LDNLIRFVTAEVYCRKIKIDPKLATYGTHKMRKAKLDTGYIIIEKEWTMK
jgi:hypothetical protein